LGLLFELFNIDNNYVLYNPIVNKFFTITYEAYQHLSNIKNKDSNFYSEKTDLYSVKLIKDLSLDKSFSQAIYMDTKQQLEYKLNHHQRQLVLEMTKACNFRCKYCILSDIYQNNDQYLGGEMSIDTMKKSIDFFLKRTSDVDSITVSFYGGEPLLRFDAIKHCVDYAKKHALGKNLSFSMTTNGSVLTEEIIDFLADNDFKILISLDGPEEIHDMNRIFQNGKKTYSLIDKNINYIRNNYPDFFKKNIQFHAVIAFPQFTNEVIGFFRENYSNNFGYAYVEPGFDNEKFKNKYQINMEYSKKYSLVNHINETKKKMIEDIEFEDNITYLFDGEIARVFKLKPREQNDSFWPGGTCDIGSRRIFVDVNGNIFPCEKISYSNGENCIGHIEKGFDVPKICQTISEYEKTCVSCQTCWCAHLCRRCWKNKCIDEGFCNDMKNSVYKQIEDSLTLFFNNPSVVKRYDKVELK